MIPANELRIGNKVKDRGGKVMTIDYWERPGMVAQNVVLDGITMHPLTEMCEYLQPIPLTPEILERCGFERRQTDFGIYWKKNNVSIREENEGYELFASEWTIGNTFYFLHQFQNILFDLFNEELNIDL